MPKSAFNCFKEILKMPHAAWLIFAASVGSLVFAFTAQYGFGIEPCILCWWQRLPFAVAALLALAAVFVKPCGERTQIILGFCSIVFMIGAGLALFHTGVEQHWWLGTSGCTVQPLEGGSVEDIRQRLLHTVVARCDQISWTFLGFSMANWNIPFSLGLSGFSFIAASKSVK